MANKNRPEGEPSAARQPEQPAELLPVDTLREQHKISRPIFAGVCAANGWKPGRAVTEEAFLRAVSAFTGAPMGAPPEKGG